MREDVRARSWTHAFFKVLDVIAWSIAMWKVAEIITWIFAHVRLTWGD